MSILGVDIASYQTIFNAGELKEDGASWCYIKATEGTTYAYSEHRARMAQARAARLVTLAYHFARPGSPEAQANYFLDHADVRRGERCVLDLETSVGNERDFVARFAKVTYERTGRNLIVYSGQSFASSQIGTLPFGCAWIIASYGPAPGSVPASIGGRRVLAHQFTSDGHPDGDRDGHIGAGPRVDLNVLMPGVELHDLQPAQVAPARPQTERFFVVHSDGAVFKTVAQDPEKTLDTRLGYRVRQALTKDDHHRIRIYRIDREVA